jgi:hypothetical protein
LEQPKSARIEGNAMTIIHPAGTPRTHSHRPSTGPAIAVTAALAGTLAFAAAVQPSLSRDALLPAASTLLFVFAAVVALIAWRSPVPARQFTYWDAAGLLTLIGVCAAAAVEPEQMVRLVAGTERLP